MIDIEIYFFWGKDLYFRNVYVSKDMVVKKCY